jgi:hypothetical protein
MDKVEEFDIDYTGLNVHQVVDISLTYDNKFKKKVFLHECIHLAVVGRLTSSKNGNQEIHSNRPAHNLYLNIVD